jgi:autotransporter-associated beta strand protein
MHTLGVRVGVASGRDYVYRGFLFVSLILFSLIAPSAADASTYRWQFDGSGNWNDPAQWALVEGPAGAGYPNLAGDVAIFDVAPTAERTATIPDGVTITIGRLVFDYNSAQEFRIVAGGVTSSLVFDNLGEDVVIEANGVAIRRIMAVQINADLVVAGSNIGTTGLVLTNGISESGGARNVTVDGASLSLGGTNTYSGTTTVADGSLGASHAPSSSGIPGPVIVGDGVGDPASARVNILGDAANHSAPVTVNRDGSLSIMRVILGSQAATIGDLSIFDGRVDITGGLSGTLLEVGNLSMEGGLLAVNHQGSLRVRGSVTATSTAAGPARIETSQFANSAVGFVANPTDFTIADGPQPIDFIVGVSFQATAGGIRKLGAGVARLTANGSYGGPTTVLGGTLLVDSSIGNSAVSVATQTTLGGSGAVGTITAATNSTVLVGGATGTAVRSGVHGILESGSVALNASNVFFDIAGGAPGATFDQLKVVGTVALGNSVLSLTSSLVLPPSGAFTIVDNDGVDPVVGTFAGLPEGATVNAVGGGVFAVSYHGGDGNDVVLANMTPVTYFLSEGATGTFFDEDVLIANPNAANAPVTMTFFLPGGSTIVQQGTVPAQSRLTVRVNEIPGLEATSPSVEVKSDNRLTLAVERTMFWDKSHYGGHTANAVPELRREWLFAEGAQNNFFQTYLLLVNPSTSLVTAAVTFLREGESAVTKAIDLPANSRVTVYAGDHAELVGRSFGITVNAPLAIAAERAMYFASTPGRLWSGGHANEGSPAASASWFHPEGASGTFFSTFILVSNPQDTPANVTYKFLLPSGQTVQTTRTIAAKQRLTLNPVDTGDLALANASFSTVVTSDVPVVSERAMYWPGDDTPFGEGHASAGLTTTSLDWVLAEGRVGGPSAYTTYILLANPQTSAANVTVTFLPETGAPIVRTLTVNATSRFNIDVGGMVPELQNRSFGARVQVTNNRAIAVERSLYWNADGRFWAGGSNAPGSIVPQ